MRSVFRTGGAGAAVTLLLLAHNPSSAWDPDGETVCGAPESQANPQLVADGDGGTFIAWQDRRGGTSDIYALRLDAAGAPVAGWPADGIPVCTAAGDQQSPRLVYDASGGALLVWSDARNGDTNHDVYALHLDGSGGRVAGWPEDGLTLCSATGNQDSPEIAADGAGGAVVAWQDGRNGALDIEALHVLANGDVAPGWAVDGVTVCGAAGNQFLPVLCSDGLGGAIVAWHDLRNPTSDLYAQHVTAAGGVDPSWSPDGVPICTAAGGQQVPKIVSDAAGGAVLVWSDTRAVNYDLYAQRVSAAGVILWSPPGVAVATTTAAEAAAMVASNGSGGAFVTWTRGNDIHALDINADGSRAAGWPANGLAICTDASAQSAPVIAADSDGGAVVAWEDLRGGANSSDIYAQHVTANGVLEAGWVVNGIGMCRAEGAQASPAILPQADGGASLVWTDFRNGGTSDVFAVRFTRDGVIEPSWRMDGNWLSRASGTQTLPGIATDGAGGAIVAWQDARGGSMDIYARRVAANGGRPAGWFRDGVALCTEIGAQSRPAVVPRTDGGAFVLWVDSRSDAGDIYFQIVDGVGQAQGSGVVCTAAGAQQNFAAVADGVGGVFVAWEDQRGGIEPRIFTQHFNAAGGYIGPGNGTLICSISGPEHSPAIAPDGTGGAYIAWSDERTPGETDVYLQRVTSSGGLVAGWPPQGVAVCTATGNQFAPALVPDGDGGAIVAWSDTRIEGNADIYAQRVLASGAIADGWAVDGVPACRASEHQSSPRLIVDEAGGALIIWDDGRADIAAQHLGSDGHIASGWPSDGIVLCDAPGIQWGARLAPDGSGGAIVAWQDARTGAFDIYVQRVLSSGTVVPGSTPNGVLVCGAAGDQLDPVVVSDASGGVIVAWDDARDGAADIYAQRIGPGHGLPTDTPIADRGRIELAPGWPNPFGDRVQVGFSLPAATIVRIEVFDVAGRRVRVSRTGMLGAGSQQVLWDGRGDDGAPQAPGVYLLRVRGLGLDATRKVVKAH